MQRARKLSLDWAQKSIFVQFGPSQSQSEIVLESVAHQLHSSLFLENQGQNVVRIVEETCCIDISNISPHIEEKLVADVLCRIEDRFESATIMPEVLHHESGYFRCFRITSEDKQDLKDFFRLAFALEPLNTHLGLKGQQASANFINYIVDTFSDNGFGTAVKDTRSKRHSADEKTVFFANVTLYCYPYSRNLPY